MTFILLLAAAAFFNGAIGAEVRIKNADEFIEFKDNVSKGKTYSGTTVFLDSDLSFSGKSFEPIGNESKYFWGVFDGQGHVISNLAMNSTSQYVGLFGYSYGLTIKNLILDSSCSITCSYVGSKYAYIGGIIAFCLASSRPCTIENSVNMESVSFIGSTGSGYSLYFGGIAGYLQFSPKCDSTVKNCANYGDVTDSGTTYISNIGGIVGESWFDYLSHSSSKDLYIYNCFNHGTITHSGTTSYSLRLGGIIGYTYYSTTIENCVSGGKISLLTTASSYDYIGSIVGYAYSSGTSIKYTYFTSDLSGYDKYGEGTPSSESNTFSYDSTSFELGETVSIGSYSGTSLIGALNTVADYYTLRDYSHWLLNKENNAVSFTIIERTNPIKMNSQVILLPSLASEGNLSFDGWYTDNGLTTPLTEYEVTSGTQLYGRWEENNNSYTISFDTRREGVSVAPITAPFGTVVTLPTESVGGQYFITFWETEYGDNVGLSLPMPSYNITLYAVWGCTRIKTPEDFAILRDSVNKGADYSGTTVFLDSDLSLAGKPFEPIGDSSNYFLGVFDGQGHVISNLAINSTSQRIGLFGNSGGLTIKNVILDSSCSITSTFSGSDYAYVGGIIGRCTASSRPCTIENSVNMGSITFSGTLSSSYLHLGGISGYLIYSYSYYGATMKNCANYGGLKNSGESRDSNLGGIVGYSYGLSSSKRAYIYNCLNYGTITHSGTTSNILRLGGIAGFTYYTTIENCVSGGKISLPTTASINNYIGSIVGYDKLETSINYTYFTSDLSGYNITGSATPTSESNTLSYDSASFELSETVSIGSYSGSSLIDVLNAAADYYTLREYSHWLLNEGKNAVSFTINGRTSPIKMDYQVILLPSLASEGDMSFDGWYTDDGLTTPLTEFETTGETELHGKYFCLNFTVTLDVNGGDELVVKEMLIDCDRVYGELPNATRTGYTFLGWFTGKTGWNKVKSGDEVTILSNHTLYAHWSINKYTLTFNLNNGTDPVVRVLDFNEAITYPANPVRAGYSFAGWDNNTTNMPANNITITAQWTANEYTVTFNPSGGIASQSTKDVTFGSAYGELPNATRTGYTFVGWFTEKNESITGESIVKIPDNHTLYAHWLEVAQSQVEIVFSKKDMGKKEIEEAIRKYTNADFKITVIESSDGDEDGMRVIVEFVDAEEAKEFSRTVNTAIKRGEVSLIKRVDFVQEGTDSFSPAYHPMSLLYLI